MISKPPAPSAPVPAGRVASLLQFGRLAGELATGAAREGIRRALAGDVLDPLELVLNARSAEKLARRLSEMRGAAMKMGQLLSLEVTDVLPREFAAAFELLRADAHHMPLGQLVGVLEQEYGRDWQSRFKRFGFTPVAAASIGQVHAAETRDGRRLALKIQYPGVRASIDSDIDNLALLFGLLKVLPEGLDLQPLLAEAKAQLQCEADYRLEAQYLQRYRALTATDPIWLVPEVHEDFSTDRILAMDYLDGAPIDTLAAGASQALRDRTAQRLVELLLREVFDFRLMQTDPNFANFLFQPDEERNVLLDMGATRPLEEPLVQGYAAMARALLDHDRQGIRQGALAVGYIRHADPEPFVQAMTAMVLQASEPIQRHGPYDFAGSDLPMRVTRRGQELFLRQGYAVAPPPATQFIHRKVVGTFLLCARLGARVDVNALLQRALASYHCGAA